ncbi:MAG TPA: FAD-dependent oxidoreductase [Burkholderiales bacterium]|nr:FAD-dependent oxidoreductase [Burkholderiales bacterium]
MSELPGSLKASYDAVVVGGGPVGAAAALELHAAGFDIVLLEARPPGAASDDLRPLALSHGSRLILERLGVWEGLDPATPIERIHISHRGRLGRAVFTAAEARLPALGYVVDYRGLVAALGRALDAAGVPVLRGASVTSLAHDKTSARLELATSEGPRECIASLVIVADGSAASTAIDVRETDYGQSALTALVTTDRPHTRTAYERFTPDGPLALLPLASAYALVWTLPPAEAQALSEASPAHFIEVLQGRFGERAGRFVAVRARAVHRVVLRVAERTTAGRTVLIGNAAQALHPVAGQGFNLGLRDAWELASAMRDRGAGAEDLLETYRARRRIDRTGGIGFTHALVRLFSNDWLPLAAARGAGLMLVDCLPPVKDFVVRRMVFGYVRPNVRK